MMWFIRFQRHFEIRMVITQALYDEGIKYSSNIDGIFGEIIPSPGIISASRVGVKDRRTHPGVENGVYSPILHPYKCDNTPLGGKGCQFSNPSPRQPPFTSLQNYAWFSPFAFSLLSFPFNCFLSTVDQSYTVRISKNPDPVRRISRTPG